MDPATAAVLGVVQGLTEFLPISSDGHLALAAFAFGEIELSLTMVVVLHTGTLLATLLVFGRDLWALTCSLASGLRAPRSYLGTVHGKLLISIVVASIPTAIVGLVLHDAVEPLARIPWVVGACLLGSALAVGSTRWSAGGDKDSLSWHHSLLVGLAQGLAVLPGLTRSGSTIAVAMLLGMGGPAAFRYSFLLSIPAVAGATALELAKPGALAGLGSEALVGGAVSFVVGLGALLGLRALVSRGRFWTFALYLVPLGVGLIAW
ncbi:MAG: undecaprenyl-diphosphate phosphatase, partial [Sandaracinaceae bacterium]|nr:undecaprenyl-diphosphate phosphatase [Sandaracinaceae bacterium]